MIAARKRKSRLWRKYRENRETADYERYIEHRNHTTRITRKAKQDFEKKLADNIKTDPKSFYSYVKSKSKTKERMGPLVDSEGNVVEDDSSAANLLNEFFTSVYSEENTTNMPTPTQIWLGNEDNRLIDAVFTPHNIEKLLLKLDRGKAPGTDGVQSTVLKEVAKEIAMPLSTIFRKSLDSGEVPTNWKEANVTPIFKKGRKDAASNYRPVSLTSQVSKIFEKILRMAIVAHLTDQNLILETQHGFMPGKSCLTNLLTFVDDISKSLDEGRPVDVIYLDFSKAFDRVAHQRLASKLTAHGIEGKVRTWICNWLAGRRQRVVVNGAESGWSDVTSGVPQGSVLGPVLFILYINDIDLGIDSRILKFADDTKIYRQVPSTEEATKLQNDLKTLFKWSTDWQMSFNESKCKCLHVGRSNQRRPYTIGESVIEEVKSERDLGVKVDESFQWSVQCAEAAKKANRILGMIRRAFTFRSPKTIRSLYISLVRPHLDYCIPVWRPSLQRDVDLLESVQRRMTRIVPGSASIPYHERLEHMNITSLETRRFRADLIETFKILKGLEGLRAENFFTLSTSTRTRGHDLKLLKVRPRLDLRKYSFSSRVVNEWNALSPAAVESESVNAFKGHVDKYLLRRSWLYTSMRQQLPAT